MKARRDNELPMAKQSQIDKLLPSRETPLTEMLEASMVEPTTLSDMSEPTRARPATLNELPSRPAARSDIDEPTLKKSKADMALPQRTKALSDREEPKVKECAAERLEVMYALPPTDTPEPQRVKDLMLTVEPRCVN